MILRLLGGCTAAIILKTALDFDVFTYIYYGENTSDSLANKLSLNKKALSIFLDALYALGFLKKEDEKYFLTPLSENFLVKGKNTYIGDFRYLTFCAVSGIKNLKKIVEKGESDFEFEWENKPKGFLLLIKDVAEFLAKNLWEKSEDKVLIYGVCAGIFAHHLICENENLNVKCVDLPSCNKISIDYIKKNDGDLKRVSFSDYDFIHNSLWKVEGKYKKIIICNLFHFTNKGGVKDLISDIKENLFEEGEIYVADFFINKERTAPRFPLLFRVYLLSSTKEGDVPNYEEIEEILKDQGFYEIKFISDIPKAYNGYAIVRAKWRGR